MAVQVNSQGDMMLTSADNSIIVRLKLTNKADVLSRVSAAIAGLGGNIGAIDIIRVENDTITRDLTVYTGGKDHGKQIVEKIRELPDVEVCNVSDRTFLLHLGGKIEIKSRIPVKNRDDLSMAYTPGVARICMAINEKPDKAYNLTVKHNMVAVVSDGTAVLGLGDIGPKAAMPVMEGKALLFKAFANVDAFPICLDTKDPDEIVRTIKNIAPGFGGINLEDISAPRCFEIEARLKAELDIPVFHDDQHGTAIVFAAALINALKIVNKKPEDLKIIINGVGAAGTACTKMLQNLGATNIIGCDTHGALLPGRDNLNSVKEKYAAFTNPHKESGLLADVIKNADVFIGLSAPNVIQVEHLKSMNSGPIVFAMANPTPEIMPEIAAPHVAIMATGRSDYPNQINNLLAFPGVFRGALDCHASEINEAMKLAAAHAIANVIPEAALSPDYIVPSVFDPHVATACAEAVAKAAIETGVARK